MSATSTPLSDKISAMPTSFLKLLAKQLMMDHRDGAEIVLSCVLDHLMKRMSENDFVQFCEAMEA